MNPKIKTWTIGHVTVTRISEFGEVPMEPGFMLQGATPDMVKAVPWMRPYFALEDGKILIAFQAFIVDTGRYRIVVDTCFGNDKDRPETPFHHLQLPFLEDLAAAGYPAETIDIVLCTHLHADHVGWNTRKVEGKWVPTFPNARYLISEKEFSFWSTGTHEWHLGDYMADSVMPIIEAGLHQLVAEDHQVTDEVRLQPTNGHTPGHVSIRIVVGDQQAVITGDLMHSPLQCVHPDISSNFCGDPAQARESRHRALADWSAHHALVIGSHFGGPTAGRLSPDGAGYDFIVE
jgi:glyoxylase-like metal-dependent hydrolase (beta-lactamase superfamily II)